MGYKVLREEPDHFVIEIASGPLRVAKAGLSPEAVRHYSKGAQVAPPSLEEILSGTPDPMDPATLSVPAPDEQSSSPTPFEQAIADVDQAQVAQEVDPKAAAAIELAEKYPSPAYHPAAPLTLDNAYAMQAGGSGAGWQAAPAETAKAEPPKEEERAFDLDSFLKALNSGKQANEKEEMPAPLVSASSDLKAQGELPGVKEARDAMLARGQIAKDAATAQAAAIDQAQKQRQAMLDTYNKQMSDFNTKREQLLNEVKNKEIKSHRYWNSKSTGEKISATIGLILGGMAGGRGPNHAFEMLNRQIDRDIQSQRDDLENSRGVLREYAALGHDIQAQYQLAKADYETIVAGMLLRASTEYAGTDKAKELEQMANQFTTDAHIRQAAVAQQAAQTAVMRAEVGLKHQELKQKQEYLNAMKKLGSGGGADNPFLPAEVRQSIVNIPGIGEVRAIGPEEGKEVRASLSARQNLRSALQKLADFRKGEYSVMDEKGKPRKIGGKTAYKYGENARVAEDLVSQAVDAYAAMKGIHNLANLSASEQENFKRRIGKPDAWLTSDDAFRSMNDSISKEADRLLAESMKKNIPAMSR